MIKIDNSPINWWKVLGGFFIVALITSSLKNCNEPNNEINNKNKTELYLDSIYKASEDAKSKMIANIDVNKLKPYFRTKKDEFSNNNIVWYYPANAPKFTNMNGIYFYFMVQDGIASNLRFVLQYTADEWLFIQNVQFLIDGVAYSYTPNKIETDNGNGGQIWEWFDESADTDKLLIKALADAKTAKMKLNGRQYYKEKKITPEQLKSFRRTYELYLGMKGEF